MSEAFVRFVSRFSRKNLSAVLMILGIIPVIATMTGTIIGLPLPVAPSTMDFYNAVKSVRDGGYAYIDIAEIPSVADVWRDRDGSIFDFFARKHLKMVFVFFTSAPSAAFMKPLLDYIGLEKKYGYVYGRDYVIFPYLAGEEAAFAATATSLKGAFKNDVFGNPVENLELLKYVDNMADFDMTYSGYISTEHHPDMMARTWWIKYPKVVHVIASKMVNVRPYYGTYVKGLLDGIAAFGEWQYLTKYKGEDLMYNDVTNLTGTATLIMIFLGTISFQIERRKAKFPLPGMIGEPISRKEE